VQDLDELYQPKGNDTDYGDWTAYFSTPFTFGDVLNCGNKMPQQVAEELFPEWAKKGLNWRA